MTSATITLVIAVTTFGFSFSPPVDLDQPPRPVEPPPRPPGKRDPRLIKEVVPKIAKLTSALDALPELSRASIEQVLGTSLGPLKKTPEGHCEYEAQIPSGPFKTISFRHADPASRARFWILGFALRDGLYLKPSDFDAGLIGPRSEHRPDQPGGSTVAYVASQRGQKRRFIFRLATSALLSVTLYRGNAARM